MAQHARFRRLTLAIWDVAAWFLATLALVAARWDFRLPEDIWRTVLLYAAAGGVGQLLIGWLSMAYRGRFRIGSFEEAAHLARTALVLWLGLSILFLFVLRDGPRGVVALVPFGALLLMAAGRFVLRALLQLALGKNEQAERVIIYGAGNAGIEISRMILSSGADSPYEVVGFVDDDLRKQNLHIGSIRVLGTGAELIDLADTWRAEAVLLAIANAPQELIRSVTDAVETSGRRMLVLPPLKELVDGKVELAQVQEVDVTDLLGRKQIRTDLREISHNLHDKVVLVTGAGGSIGSEIARQVHRFGPRELVLLDRDESGLHGTQLSIYGTGLLDTPDMVLCDIRDPEALDRVFRDHRPAVVFHAAALKHLPLLEQYPDEAWKTNVLGTRNVLEAAARYGVERFVNISTDKAADPTSVLGSSKRIAEEITAWHALNSSGIFVSVRFGNVLGSRGSVLHTFRQQIEAGGPVTVTDAEVTRYFMTIPEACELTLQAAVLSRSADVLVLDMGEPVRIVEVAERLIQQADKDIKIVFTGLREGEKLHEVLFSDHEDSTQTEHSLISRVAVAPRSPEHLAERGFNGTPIAAGSISGLLLSGK
ncbi:MAG: nucleoside-diphosphate sugar epimerase/dehydratase [Propionibacteriaceae bacterium]|nr:nucleoside-diphosphate sugar epimerase/dehydratase [Propionibacteriaceae bacterium]